eukprot:1405277-Prymnesium_polylepis.1
MRPHAPASRRLNASGSVPSARALRMATALAIAGLIVEMLVAAVGRRLLLLGAATSTLATLHGFAWAAEASIALQEGGLLCLLPERLVRGLLGTSLLDLLDVLHTGRREIEHLTAVRRANPTPNRNHTPPSPPYRLSVATHHLPRHRVARRARVAAGAPVAAAPRPANIARRPRARPRAARPAAARGPGRRSRTAVTAATA